MWEVCGTAAEKNFWNWSEDEIVPLPSHEPEKCTQRSDCARHKAKCLIFRNAWKMPGLWPDDLVCDIHVTLVLFPPEVLSWAC